MILQETQEHEGAYVLTTFSIENDLDFLVHCALLNEWALLTICYSYFHTSSRLRVRGYELKMHLTSRVLAPNEVQCWHDWLAMSLF